MCQALLSAMDDNTNVEIGVACPNLSGHFYLGLIQAFVGADQCVSPHVSAVRSEDLTEPRRYRTADVGIGRSRRLFFLLLFDLEINRLVAIMCFGQEELAQFGPVVGI